MFSHLKLAFLQTHLRAPACSHRRTYLQEYVWAWSVLLQSRFRYKDQKGNDIWLKLHLCHDLQRVDRWQDGRRHFHRLHCDLNYIYYSIIDFCFTLSEFLWNTSFDLFERFNPVATGRYQLTSFIISIWCSVDRRLWWLLIAIINNIWSGSLPVLDFWVSTVLDGVEDDFIVLVVSRRDNKLTCSRNRLTVIMMICIMNLNSN